jgi:chemotaxis protein CheD
MADIILGVGELAATNAPGDILKTFALGSCVAVIVMDPRTRTIGMAHIALPESRINLQKKALLPGYFADSCIPELFRQMQNNGAEGPSGMVVKLAGGAQIMDPNNTFSIGLKNSQAVKMHLMKFGLEPYSEDLGKNYSRTVIASVDTGVIELSSPGRPKWYL